MGLLEDFIEEEVKVERKDKKVEPIIEKYGGIHLETDSKHEMVSTKQQATYEVNVVNDSSTDQDVIIEVKLLYSADMERGVVWKTAVDGEIILSDQEETFSKVVSVPNKEEKTLRISVEPPPGAIYGEKFEVVIDATSKKDQFLSDSITLITIAKPTVIAVKTQIGQEKNIADYLAGIAKRQNLGIYSILSPKPVKGYIFLEVMSPELIDEAVSGMRKVRGVVEGESSIEEIEHFLTPKLAVEGIAEGDIVELSAGPFKSEKARVIKIDEANDEITVELFEATVPIPVTVRGDHVRVLEKEKNR